MKYFFKYLLKSFKSIVGFFILRFFLKSHGFFPELENKKILVLGTGPSLNKINQDIIDNYDVILFMTHAIKILNLFNFRDKEIIFFCGDALGIKETYKDIIKFNNFKKFYSLIYVIHYFSYYYFLTLKFKNVEYVFSKVKIFGSFKKENRINCFLSDRNFYQRKKVAQKFENYTETFPYTGSLSLFHFLIHRGSSLIHALGCDYNNSRTSVISTTTLKSTFNKQRSKIIIWFKLLSKIAKLKKCELKNLSFNIDKK